MPSPNRPALLDLAKSGAVGDGVTNDSAAIGSWLTGLAAAGITNADIQVRKHYYVPDGFAIPSFTTFHGTRGGGFYGNPAFASTSVPIPATKLTAYGTMTGAGTAYGSVITPGSIDFTLTNTFAAGQYVLLRNYPTDPGGTDAYTVASDGRRLYNVGSIGTTDMKIDPANLRQFRRIEPARVRSASSSSISLDAPVAFDYNYTQGLQFVPFTPAKSICFDDIYMQDIFLDLQLADRFLWQGGRLFRTTISVARSLNCDVLDVQFDAADADCCVGFGRSSRFSRVTGNFRGGGGLDSDNSVIRFDQASDFSIDAVGCAHKRGVYLFLGDTNYFEDPGMADGQGAYTDVPLRNFHIKLIDSGNNNGAFLSCDPFAAGIDTGILDFVSGGGSSPQAVYLKGCANVIARLMIPRSGLRIDGSLGISLDGMWQSFFAPANLANPRGTGTPRVNSVSRSTYTAGYIG